MNYNKIYDLVTNKHVSIKSKKGIDILKKYLNYNFTGGGSIQVNVNTEILKINQDEINGQLEYHIIGDPNAKYKIFIFHEMGAFYTRWKDEVTKLAQNMSDYVFVIPNRPGYGNSKGFFNRNGKPLTQTNISKLTDIVSPSLFKMKNELARRNNTKKINTNKYVGYSYRNFSQIIKILADDLKWDKFYVTGYSSGGPCALACAAHLGKRVLGVSVVSGDTDYRRIKFEENKDVSKLGLWTNSLIMGDLLHGFHLLSYPDSADGYNIDFFLERSGWDFNIEDIKVPIIFTHGEKDNPGMIYGTHWAKSKNNYFVMCIVMKGLTHITINTPLITINLCKLLVKLNYDTIQQNDGILVIESIDQIDLLTLEM